MLTVNGQKMSKSLGNSFLPHQLFSGNHPLLERGYSPMTVRFFMLQAHYRSTLDFSNEALAAAEKGYQRLMNALKLLPNIKVAASSSFSVEDLKANVYEALNDDFNTSLAIASLFEAASNINSVNDGNATITTEDKETLQQFLKEIVEEVLGLREEIQAGGSALSGLMELVLDLRKDVRDKKDFATSDKIRDTLKALNIQVKDGKEGTTWNLN
jgi:cysteinyl-tRNA synthetase